MVEQFIPKWLDALERRFPWFQIPNLGLYIVVLQSFGFLLSVIRPELNIAQRLSLDPMMILQGEWWRLFTFLAIPLSSGFWMIFVLWFIYFIFSALEAHWGAFKLTFYLFLSVLLTILFAFTFSVPVDTFTEIESTLFLAAAVMMPDYEILLFMILPVKMKWMGWLSVAFLLFQFFFGGWLYRFYLLLVFANYFIFFSGHHFFWVKQRYRSYQFRKQWKK